MRKLVVRAGKQPAQWHTGTKYGNRNRARLALYSRPPHSQQTLAVTFPRTPKPRSQLPPHIPNFKITWKPTPTCPILTTFTPDPSLVSRESNNIQAVLKPESQDPRQMVTLHLPDPALLSLQHRFLTAPFTILM